MKEKILQVRITEYEEKQLTEESRRRKMSKSQLIRSFIARLPDPSN